MTTTSSAQSATDTEEPSRFAMTEAAMIRRGLTDTEWDELLTRRPSLKDALTAHRQRTDQGRP